ncbi:c-type cytochrome biogenesis protein CcmI [Vibrio sp. V27_P1S3P104]|uniref:c-type cytochrome biogenesis protein CcmI n=1 Tax=unclassified Vibrio TaxID=2614977 RepID=UPI0013724D14|nr:MULTISPECIES: c-type cytochrome biogenesis protein CcmI [unclassified Vibrio]NAW68732.1 c-type cytochrome biogenesis protein CcmI [Vibrio sp. V28_P6S34P95]NAX04557.1 c-type cytochrome biogenesis protein CcmI [Vibrio sp. V30_P3S12P165]NAX33546.1 c-type cytochrome biogenesis protein CcmI [Vibrio sp. V29_P1S30P107]NAX38767.1 c-type cytochrome biogenesis protein CcmI [Vibrio sp. V27_P1S3P104]NAX40988.1 c-type cytochrome biogenesis protein CcmI [Vibrio sp. V26_P1S5P106]
MTLFWLSTLILVIVASLFIAIPMSQRTNNNDQPLRDELNKAFYKDRLAELEAETQEGFVDDPQALITDLKQSLLDDVPSRSELTRESMSAKGAIFVLAMLLMITLSYGLYAEYGSYSQVKHWQQVSASLPELSKKLMIPSPHGVELTDQEMQDLTLSLRTRLHYQANDATGWLLLGRIGMANRDMQTAIGASKKAYELAPKDGDVQFGYAQALILSNDEWEQNQARTLLLKLAQADDVDLRVFSLLAFDAFENSDYTKAIAYWQQMQQMIGPNDTRYDMLTRSIESAQRNLSANRSPALSVKVTVRLADTVIVPKDGVLIVSIHSADGASIPVAAARYPLSQFPVTVLLDNSNSMLQGRDLSQLERLIVRARLDNDGNVATREGDWFGESTIVEIGDPVDITIDTQYH